MKNPSYTRGCLGLTSAAVFLLACFPGCERADADLKVGTCLKVCRYTAKKSKRDVSEVHPTTKLSEVTRGPLRYGFFVMGLENQFDVPLVSNMRRLIGNNSRTSALGNCTMKEFADVIDELQEEKMAIERQ